MVNVALGYDDDREVPFDALDYEYAFSLDPAVWDRAETSFAMGMQEYGKAAEAIIRSGGRVGSVTVNPA